MALANDTCDDLNALDAEPRELELPTDVPPLRMFYLYLSAGCNLNCQHCWITPSFVNGRPVSADCLDIELIKKAVAEAKPLGLSAVKLTGGEPTLHPDFIQIVDFLFDQELSITMETNGTLIDLKMARHLFEKNRLSHISVSLDSPDPEWHDCFRGKRGAFDAAVGGIKHLVDAGFRPQIIMSVIRENVSHIEGLIDLSIRLGAGSVKFNPVISLGRGTDLYNQGLELPIEAMIDLMHRVRGPIQDKYGIYLCMMLPPALMSVREILRYNGLEGNCHVQNILGLLGSGAMALCGIGRNVPELCFGKLGKDNIYDVWLTHPTLLQMRRDLNGLLPGLCGNCIHARRCQTHCLAMNYEATGKLVNVSPICSAAMQCGLFPENRKRE